jgi:hypothetical protein
MEQLIDRVLDQIKIDFESGDLTAIEELLGSVPKAKLEAYLPEETGVDAELSRFHEYVMSFYGVRGDAIYDYEFTMGEVTAATRSYIESLDKPEDFCGDSVDRERVRDIVFEAREAKKV